MAKRSRRSHIIRISSCLTLVSGIFPAPVLAAGYRLPFSAGTPVRVTQSCIDSTEPNCEHSRGFTPYSSSLKYAVDFACDIGQPITAIQGGVVDSKGFHPSGYGHHVKVRHSDGRYSLYAHFHSPSPLTEGMTINQGDTVGSCGNTGASTGSHLHLELRNREFLDLYAISTDPILFDECATSELCIDGQVNYYPDRSYVYISANTGVVEPPEPPAEPEPPEETERGRTQYFPVISSIFNRGWKSFVRVFGGLWFDPPTKSGLEYAAEDDTQFKSIVLPVDLDVDDLYTVEADGNIVGEFSGGEKIEFDQAVTAFKLLDIETLSGEVTDIPLLINFVEPVGSFRVRSTDIPESIPEPVSGFGIAGFGLIYFTLKKAKRKSISANSK